MHPYNLFLVIEQTAGSNLKCKLKCCACDQVILTYLCCSLVLYFARLEEVTSCSDCYSTVESEQQVLTL